MWPCSPAIEPAHLEFGPFELANPVREARVKLGPDETEEVRAAVGELVADIVRRTGVTLKRSTYSSPIGGDVFVSTQPWAAKTAWFVKLKRREPDIRTVGVPLWREFAIIQGHMGIERLD